MAAGSPRFLLVYGSQTGQSKAVAEEIFERSTKIGLNADINCFSSYGKKFTFEAECVAVIVISSTGDGEPPETARKFYRAIQSKALSATYLCHLKYALLGLGDSNYTSCWNCPKTVDKRLQELGAVQFYSSGFADDATGLEVVVEPWVEGLFVALRSQIGSPNSAVPISGPLLGVAQQQQQQQQQWPVDGDVRPAADASPEELPASTVTTMLQQLQLNTKVIGGGTDDGRAGATPTAEGLNSLKGCTESGVAATTSASADAVAASQGLAGGTAVTMSTDAAEEARCIRSLRLDRAALTLPSQPERFLCVDALDCQHSITDEDIRCSKARTGNPDVHAASVLRADVLTGPAAPKKTLLLQLSLVGTGLSYEPGDAFGLHCENDAREVLWLIERLRVPEDEAERPMSITVMPKCSRKLARVPDHLVSSASLRQLFTYCTEIRAVPKKAFIRLAAEYTSDERERQRLLELSSREGSEDYADIVMAGRISFLDLLAFFPSCQPPVEVMLENLPPLQPRSYSAASSQLRQSDTVDIVFNIMNLRSFEGQVRTGLCTGWLNQLTSELQAKKVTPRLLPKVLLFPRKIKNFRLPCSTELPVLMICAGTGIAPFVGFLEHRYQQQIAIANSSPGKLWLFYGCRHADKDFLFREKLVDMVHHGVLTKCVVCFSQQKQVVAEEQLPRASSSARLRAAITDLAQVPQPSCVDDSLRVVSTGLVCADVSSSESQQATLPDLGVGSPFAMQQCNSSEQQQLAPVTALTNEIRMVPGYVQDALSMEARAVGEMVWTEGAHVYVCGSTGMAKGVLEAMTAATAAFRDVSAAEASAMIKELKLSKRYLEDVWS